jgi:hypothetical protein
MAESNYDKMVRMSAVGGRRGRGSRKAPYGPENDDGPRGDDIVTRLETDPKGGSSVMTFPMNGSRGAQYPANTMKKSSGKSHDNLVTPGKWHTKNGC